MMELELSGLDELTEELDAAVKYYPDECRRTLKASGKKFKKHTKKIVEGSVKTNKNITKGFSTTEVKGLGMDMYVDFTAEGKKNPHFHLVEKGHKIIMPFKRNGKRRKDGGEERGDVPGKHNMPRARESFRDELVEDLSQMADRILKEAGLK